MNNLMFDGAVSSLADVMYALELKRNMISLSELDNLSYSFRDDKGVMKVVKRSLILMRGARSHKLYNQIGSTVIRTVKIVLETNFGEVALRHS